jgi:hypothetical protein
MQSDTTDFSNLDALLSLNAALIEQVQSRLRAQRFRPNEADPVKLEYTGCLKTQTNSTIG